MKTAEEKIALLEAEISIMKKQIERLKEIEQYTYRLKSEFEEFKNVTTKEKKRISDYANESLLSRMIPQMSNFERALKYMQMGEQSKEVQMIVKGVEMIYQSLENTLEDAGMKRIHVKIGEPFNPFEHDIAAKIPSGEYPEHTVLQVVEEGYSYNGKILKPAVVNVSVEPETDNESEVKE